VAWCRRSDTIFSQYNQLGHLLKPHHDPEPGGIHRHILAQIQLQSDWQARFPLLRTLEIKLFFWSSIPVYQDSQTPGGFKKFELVCLKPFLPELVAELQTCTINLKAKQVTISVVIEGCRNNFQVGYMEDEVLARSEIEKLPTPGCGCEEKVKEACMALFK
jgi:hypothetical protein